MKKLLFFLLLCAFPFVANAQMANADQPVKIAKRVQVDNSLMECIYHYTVIDRDLSTFREYDQILEIGDSICKYGDYGEYRLDSAMATMPVVTNRDFDVLYRRYNPESDFILLHMNSNRLDFYGRVCIDHFIYHEPKPQINWELSDSTKEVCGYLCHLATCEFRGRKWQVWYSDIPYSLGPWKLNGLPGLILEARSLDKDHVFTAITVRKSHAPILRQENDNFKTTRERFNKALQTYKENPMKSWQNTPLAPKDMNGKPLPVKKRKLFYNPLEKE